VKKVGVVGLGTGAVAAYAKPGQEWTFYEIDPAVVRIARDTAYFRFLSECQGSCDVVLGDARRQLAKVPDGTYDVIILDGFCSDAIPVHLLTREAIRMYMSKLTPHGVIALHVSNVHLDLPPLVARLADDYDPPLATRVCNDQPTDSEREDGKTPSQWMLLARSEDDLRPMLPGGRPPRLVRWDPVPVPVPVPIFPVPVVQNPPQWIRWEPRRRPALARRLRQPFAGVEEARRLRRAVNARSPGGDSGASLFVSRGRSTSSPVVRKAHGTAGCTSTWTPVEPRLTGLLQTTGVHVDVQPKAVLEQPSSRSVQNQALGRRNIALLQNSELNRLTTQPRG
jgi:hypothetical protein